MKTIRRLVQTVAAVALLLALSGCCCTKGSGKTVQLFNGKDLSGWNYFLADRDVTMQQVWSVENGLLVCKGMPFGVLYKGPEVMNFSMVVEYRWRPGEKPGNSGIFSRLNGPMKAVPPGIEVQLAHGSAGDVMGLHGKEISADQPRFFSVKAHKDAGDIAGVKKLVNAEAPPGQWNKVEVVAENTHYTVKMNGQLVNDVKGVEMVAGPVGVQSEGGIIEFRKIALTPLP